LLQKYLRTATTAALATLGLTIAACTSASAAGVYRIVKSVPIGYPDAWDFLYYEQFSHRIYVAHGNEITVVNGRSGQLVGRLRGLSGVNGIVVVPDLGKGYANSRDRKAGIVFDLTNLKVLKQIPLDEDSDGVIFDPATKRVFIMQGDPHSVIAVDAVTDTIVGSVALDGKPEFAVVDGVGKLYVNITDKREISKVNTTSLKVEATWPIAPCESPHGLSMDREARRLFSSCTNNLLMVVNADTGRVVGTVPIGWGSDGSTFDSKRKVVFSSNSDGTLSVIREVDPDTYVSLGDLATQPFARTMALDTETGRVFLTTADVAEIHPGAADPRKRFSIKPGSVHLLFMDPTP
jgi:DNA-binding beta-propeller fold protein YncE